MNTSKDDVTTILLSLLGDLKKSVDELARECHTIGEQLRNGQKDYLSLNTRVTALETWKVAAETELRDIKPVAEVIDKIKKWAITGVALGVVGILFLAVLAAGWLKLH
jgi:hypothetical protein